MSTEKPATEPAPEPRSARPQGRPNPLAIAAALAIGLILSACGGGDDPGARSTETTAAPGDATSQPSGSPDSDRTTEYANHAWDNMNEPTRELRCADYQGLSVADLTTKLESDISNHPDWLDHGAMAEVYAAKCENFTAAAAAPTPTPTPTQLSDEQFRQVFATIFPGSHETYVEAAKKMPLVEAVTDFSYDESNNQVNVAVELEIRHSEEAMTSLAWELADATSLLYWIPDWVETANGEPTMLPSLNVDINSGQMTFTCPAETMTRFADDEAGQSQFEAEC